LIVSRLIPRTGIAAVAGFLMALGASVPAEASGRSAPGSAEVPAEATLHNFLYGAAATSPANAWAVGYYSNGTAYQSLIEHWDGVSWTTVPSPDPAGPSVLTTLSGVAAISPGTRG
jgi:hypothetical protein